MRVIAAFKHFGPGVVRPMWKISKQADIYCFLVLVREHLVLKHSSAEAVIQDLHAKGIANKNSKARAAADVTDVHVCSISEHN